jgi:hypothetical protein
MKKPELLCAILAILSLPLAAPAAEKKGPKEEMVTLKGTLKCLSCSLKESDQCQTVLVAKDGDKEVKYAVTGPRAPKHSEICKTDKENVTLTGTVSEKDGTKVINVTRAD